MDIKPGSLTFPNMSQNYRMDSRTCYPRARWVLGVQTAFTIHANGQNWKGLGVYQSPFLWTARETEAQQGPVSCPLLCSDLVLSWSYVYSQGVLNIALLIQSLPNANWLFTLLWLTPFYRWGNWGWLKLRDWPKFTQLVSVEVWIQTQVWMTLQMWAHNHKGVSVWLSQWGHLVRDEHSPKGASHSAGVCSVLGMNIMRSSAYAHTHTHTHTHTHGFTWSFSLLLLLQSPNRLSHPLSQMHSGFVPRSLISHLAGSNCTKLLNPPPP